MNIFSFYKGWLAIPLLLGICLCDFPAHAAKINPSADTTVPKNFIAQQQVQVSGTITDGTNPLAGVSISVKGKATAGTISDFNG